MGAAHLGILVSVVAITVLCDLGSGLPIGFMIGEGVILAAAVPFAMEIKVPWLEDLFRFAAGPPPESHPSGDEAVKEAAKKETVEYIAGGVLIGASAVQFVALALLLWGTGGPIESPFAEMTLMIAVFTPFIANNPKTIGIVVMASVLYYAFLIVVYTGGHPKPHTVKEFKEALPIETPSDWAYFSVNVLILLGAIAFTVFEALIRYREKAAATAEEGGGSSINIDGKQRPDDPTAPAEA